MCACFYRYTDVFLYAIVVCLMHAFSLSHFFLTLALSLCIFLLFMYKLTGGAKEEEGVGAAGSSQECSKDAHDGYGGTQQ